MVILYTKVDPLGHYGLLSLQQIRGPFLPQNLILLTKPLFLMALNALTSGVGQPYCVLVLFLIVMLDNWRAVILIPYWVCRDLGLINVGLWGGHGTRMIYSSGFAVTGQIMGACMVTVYHTVDRRSISAAEFTIILNYPKSIPWSYLLLCTSEWNSRILFAFHRSTC